MEMVVINRGLMIRNVTKVFSALLFSARGWIDDKFMRQEAAKQNVRKCTRKVSRKITASYKCHHVTASPRSKMLKLP